MADTASLEGKNVVVTGAAGGLGRAMVEGLAHAGAHVVAIDLSEEALHGLASEIAEAGAAGKVLPMAAKMESAISSLFFPFLRASRI